MGVWASSTDDQEPLSGDGESVGDGDGLDVDAGPLEIVRVTVEPGSTDVRATGSEEITEPAAIVSLDCFVLLITTVKPKSLSADTASALVYPTTFGIATEETSPYTVTVIVRFSATLPVGETLSTSPTWVLSGAASPVSIVD